MKTTGIATGALLGGGLIGGLVGYKSKKSMNVVKEDKSKNVESEVNTRSRVFFTNPEEFETLTAAVERIFSKDEIGSGALGLGVPFFIDNQLAGPYGSNTEEHMQGAFYPGEPKAGYQTDLTCAEIFRQGIAKLEEEASSLFGKRFVELEEVQMDRILASFQNNKVSMEGVDSALFFRLLRSATLQGVYSNPIYNGNHTIEDWKMNGFPGHQMSFLNEIENEKAIEMEP
ncbi:MULTISPECIES: gluconate 2-dehydrogenase subunit 3 family protein [unclassified Sporosarcina]|uniref:gluconate 2-dehydrogenase subunit 3 family protein n=1 Tax=unclassified Sporosarcina TaxID=2647733 RepID=UPI001E2B8469|nr:MULTISPECIES: gluconate 2-dehydrogenase subunit 3 family protein [unclassified Sporosarcina]